MKATVTESLHIITGSNTQNLGGTGYRKLQIGEVVDAVEPTTWTSNVWITTEDGTRGKIECGSINNLIKRNILTVN